MSFSVTILGSSAATPTSKRYPSAILVNMNFTHFLMDCGEGTQIQLRRSKIKLQKIKHICISHLHGDHFFGLIGLISTFHLLGRKEDLNIYAPAPLEEILEVQLRASQTQLNYTINFHPTNPEEPEIVYETDDCLVKSFPLDHRIETTGFLFAEKQKPRKLKKSFLFFEDLKVEDIVKIKDGSDFVSKSGKVYPNDEITEDPAQPRSFAYCSDTRYFEPVVENIKNVDVLYHEATFMEDLKHVAHEKYHSTAMEAASIAKKANVDKLIIGHFSARYRELDDMFKEASAVFKNTILAEDGATIELIANEKTRL